MKRTKVMSVVTRCRHGFEIRHPRYKFVKDYGPFPYSTCKDCRSIWLTAVGRAVREGHGEKNWEQFVIPVAGELEPWRMPKTTPEWEGEPCDLCRNAPQSEHRVRCIARKAEAVVERAVCSACRSSLDEWFESRMGSLAAV